LQGLTIGREFSNGLDCRIVGGDMVKVVLMGQQNQEKGGKSLFEGSYVGEIAEKEIERGRRGKKRRCYKGCRAQIRWCRLRRGNWVLSKRKVEKLGSQRTRHLLQRTWDIG